MSDKLKILGESAADIPRIVGARLQQVQTVAESLEDAYTTEVFLNNGYTTRYEQVEQKIKSFITDAEDEFSELRTICDKLFAMAEQAAEGSSDGSKKVGLELQNLSNEIASFEKVINTETGRVDDALAELERIQGEMDDVGEKRYEVLQADFDELGGAYEEAGEAADGAASETDELKKRVEKVCDEEQTKMETTMKDWVESMDGRVDFLVEHFSEDVQEAHARVVEHLTDVTTFFENEVADPAKQKSAALGENANALTTKANEAAGNAAANRDAMQEAANQIRTTSNPLDALINGIMELAARF